MVAKGSCDVPVPPAAAPGATYRVVTLAAWAGAGADLAAPAGPRTPAINASAVRPLRNFRWHMVILLNQLAARSCPSRRHAGQDGRLSGVARRLRDEASRPGSQARIRG